LQQGDVGPAAGDFAPMVKGSQEPRIKVVPEGVEHPRWEEIKRFVKRLGYELDPWQWAVLHASLMRSGDEWAAFTVAVCAPRQNGKNSLLEVVELVKVALLEEKLLIHTAHLADTSNEAFHRLDDLIDGNDWIKTKHIWRANGRETIEFPGKRRIRFRTRTRGGGRGYAGCTTAIFDEAMFLPEVSMGSIMPVISASPDPQIWYTGSAVDQQSMDDGVAFARVRERALDGDSDRLAYFEWSLEADVPGEIEDETAADPVSWAVSNPAFGIRIKESYITQERKNLDPRTFAVERLGVGDWPPTAFSSAVIDLEKWEALTDGNSKIADQLVLAFDVKPDRSASSISAAGLRTDGHSHIEVIERRRGTHWLVQRLLELIAEHSPVAVLCDAAGPAASLVNTLEAAQVEVMLVAAKENAFACGFFYDQVEQEALRHLGTPELLAALRGAAKRPLGDAWAWSRKNSAVDISPLVACTLALWGSSVAKKPELFALTW
jgi:hypothetical protein